MSEGKQRKCSKREKERMKERTRKTEISTERNKEITKLSIALLVVFSNVVQTLLYVDNNTSDENIASLFTMRIRRQFTEDGSTLMRHVDILQKRHPVFHTCRILTAIKSDLNNITNLSNELAETSARRYSPEWALASLTSASTGAYFSPSLSSL
jgi:hypothetical protein